MSYTPTRGDIMWVGFDDPPVGHEQAGHRPALVLSSSQFNRRAQVAFCVPITSRVRGHSLEVPLPAGLRTSGVILCQHFKSVDYVARGAQFIERASDDVLADVISIVYTILIT